MSKGEVGERNKAVFSVYTQKHREVINGELRYFPLETSYGRGWCGMEQSFPIEAGPKRYVRNAKFRYFPFQTSYPVQMQIR